ncbi:hypothetical protein CJ231_11635 [Hoylesella buccalis]|uniref:Uncharacterized protein n=1 Tax=Hoylesella buccalis TaxID=28127 RepID=A0A2N6QNL4_9BACT|nr:SIR2 family protein [Hoylesella buccalis]PMC23081.1 hypothetical protein CJ231_11635 [Hoylesella buccalis]
MQIERLKDIIQSANMNFLFGSGMSRPYLSTLGEIETWLTDLNTRPGLNDVERDTLRCSIINEYLQGVILPNLQEKINDDLKGYYDETIDNYASFLHNIGILLLQRRMNLCHKTANLFTTNIDMLIEAAVRKTKLEFNDGFAGRKPAIFDEGNFSKMQSKVSMHLQKFHEIPTVNYIKLHGSINWKYDEAIVADDDLDTVKKVMDAFVSIPFLLNVRSEKQKIAKEKGGQSPLSPSDIMSHLISELKKHLKDNEMDLPFYELMRLFSNELEKPNTILFVGGFSFADEHLSKITLRAANNNPTLLIVVFAYQQADKVLIEKNLGIEEGCQNGNICVLCPEEYKECYSQMNDMKIDNIDSLKHFDLASIDKFVFQPIVSSVS